MRYSLADAHEVRRIAIEALLRYKLRTSLSVLGVVLGVAAVIAMMSVADGAARQALAQVEALGLDNLVVRSNTSGLVVASPHGLRVGDAERIRSLVPLVKTTSPLIDRFERITHGAKRVETHVLGVSDAFGGILRLSMHRGRFLTTADEQAVARVCVLGSSLARQLFGFRDPLGEQIRIGDQFYRVVGITSQPGGDVRSGAIAWREFSEIAFVPLAALSGRTIFVSPGQPVDEIWVQTLDGSRNGDLAQILDHALVQLHGGREFDIVVPRALLAQRYRTQRTFSVVVGSVAVLALLVGGIGIMNMMLTSVVERTQEIGVRRTVGATRRHVTLQFLAETLIMTLGGGAIGILAGAVTSWGISSYASWPTHVSPLAVVLGFVVSLVVGLVFGLYPAIKASRLEPVDALRYE